MASVNNGRTAAVVLNWRDSKQTVECIRSLLEEPLIAHVFVVDNESDGDLRLALAHLSDHEYTLLEVAENRGFSAGVNVGLRLALAGDFDSFLMLNNDAVLKPGSLSRLRTALYSASDVAIVAPKVTNLDGSLQSLGSRLNRVTFAINPVAGERRANYLTWACVLVRRTTFDLVGLLDERYFMYWEDVDFGFRVSSTGARQLVVPEAVVSHNISSSHSTAGSNIAGYSALGLSVFGHSQGGRVRVAAFIRLCLRAAKLILAGNSRVAAAVMRMWTLGKTNSGPAYLLFGDPAGTEAGQK